MSAASPLTVVFQSNTEFLTQRDHLSRGGFFVPIPEPPPEPFSKLTVMFVAPTGDQVEFTAQVVQIAPGAGMALSCDDPIEASLALTPLFEASAGAPDPVGAATAVAKWGAPAAASADEAAPNLGHDAEPELRLSDDELDEEKSSTLHDQIRQLSTTEKMRLARHGDRAARLLLLKDTNKTVHLFVLKNNRITLDEVRYIAGYRRTSAEVLKQIAHTKEWLQNPRVVVALVCNPKTPSAEAVRLLRKVPPNELRRIARSPSMPKAVSMAARKMVVGG